ncbi:class I SAM-dependent methyltransferase [Streptomyces collinus]|uniref:class I SAM-dependent methyltransferase n=1 Tax=Streptomyces collinus TaxID=42684 RepID=UPI00339F992E
MSTEPEAVNARAWTTYGTHHLQRGTDIPEVDRISWGFWPTGPGAEVLGDLTGLRVLDLCSGLGKHAAHLVREHGATVDAVEASVSQHARALARYGDLPGLTLIHADAVDHLHQAEPYDAIYSIHAFGYIDPHRLLPALRLALKPGGRLAFSVLQIMLRPCGVRRQRPCRGAGPLHQLLVAGGRGSFSQFRLMPDPLHSHR